MNRRQGEQRAVLVLSAGGCYLTRRMAKEENAGTTEHNLTIFLSSDWQGSSLAQRNSADRSPNMRPNRFVVVCIFLLSCFLVTSLSAQSGQAVRRPLGVYVKVDIEDTIADYNALTEPKPPLHTYLRSVYAGLLADEAISGITLGAHWSNIEPSDPLCVFSQSCLGGPDGYDWSYLDDAFEDAILAHKSVQLIITPGFDSPQWLLNKLPSCDGLFPPVTGAAPNCGKVTFVVFPESQHADCTMLNLPCLLPLPWDGIYKATWWNFLLHLSARYNDNPALVAIAVAGPVGASDEIILPTDSNKSFQQPPASPNSKPDADQAWSTLINNAFPSNSGYQNTDQVFIDQWEQTISVYESIFRGVTLFLGPDAGQDLPEFAALNMNPIMVHKDNTLWANDCNGPAQNNLPRSCEAKTEILSYFVTVAGPNGKATQLGGLTAGNAVASGDIGIAGVKLLTSLAPPAPAIFGGAEFDHPVKNQNSDQVGCPQVNTDCTNPTLTLTPEEAAYNVLTVFFYGTPAAPFYLGTPPADFYGGTPGPDSMQYLDVPYVDVQYAQMNPCPNPPSSIIGNMSLQDLLNGASRDLFEMAEHIMLMPPPTCH